jgi:hypothetical protein
MAKKHKKRCKRGHLRTPENLVGRSCRQCMRLTALERDLEQRKSNPLAHLLSQLRRNSKKRQRHPKEFTIAAKDFPVLPTHCPVLGTPLNYAIKDRGGRKSWDKPSFDRTDSSKGYVPGNVVIMSLRANVLKNSATVPELLKVIRYLWALDKKWKPIRVR